MANELKLEIYKVKLFKKDTGKPVTFREFLRNKLSLFATGGKTISTDEIFTRYYTDIVNTMDGKSYFGNTKKKKGFSIAKNLDDPANPKSRVSSAVAKDWTITGIIKGGKFDRKRTLGKFNNTSEESDINRDHIICDLFYFMIHIPLSHHEGVFMVQNYSDGTISDIFRDFITHYFTYQDIKSEVETLVPKSLKDRYLDNANLKSLSFTTVWKVSPGFEDTKQEEYDIQLKVEIVDKSKKKKNFEGITKLFEAFKNTKVLVAPSQEKILDNFVDKKATIGTTKKASTVDIDFDRDDHIKLSVPLADFGMHPDENGIPNFTEIEAYTRELLEEIIKEVRPKYAADDL